MNGVCDHEHQVSWPVTVLLHVSDVNGRWV